ncbi:MAG TPA: glycosyltransferase [Puia sp.]|nr:glycosyltransferase [Puia sp.]
MKFSIILPVRNGGDYIKLCIASILQQTYRDFNLLILDNCSSDGTSEWIKSLDDPRIRVFPAVRPLSIEENWGRIVGMPKNEFMTMIGHDDILDPHYLAAMDALIRRHPEASLYQTHFRYIDATGAVIRRCKPMDERQSPEEFLSFFLAGLIDNMGTGYMMRSADFDAAGGIPPYPNLLFADFELWIQLCRHGYKATAFEECFGFRLHQSMTTTSSDMKYRTAFERFIGYLETLQKEDPALREPIRRYAVSFIQTYCKGLAHRLLRTPLAKRDGLKVDSFVRQCQSFADRLIPGNEFAPYRIFSMRVAKYIDATWFTRQLFLWFKKLYPRPIY